MDATVGQGMAAIVVRRATLDDAPAIARVHVAAWQRAYRGQMPDAVLDGLDESGARAPGSVCSRIRITRSGSRFAMSR
jgi:hypothetical protein